MLCPWPRESVITKSPAATPLPPLSDDSATAVLFLSNRVHPEGKGNVNALRGRVATLAAAALANPHAGRAGRAPVLTGVDVLAREQFRRLAGRKVGLVTNHTGQDRAGRATIDILHKAPGVTLVALFSPEHGIRGAVDAKVADTKDEEAGFDARCCTSRTAGGICRGAFTIPEAPIRRLRTIP